MLQNIILLTSKNLLWTICICLVSLRNKVMVNVLWTVDNAWTIDLSNIWRLHVMTWAMLIFNNQQPFLGSFLCCCLCWCSPVLVSLHRGDSVPLVTPPWEITSHWHWHWPPTSASSQSAGLLTHFISTSVYMCLNPFIMYVCICNIITEYWRLILFNTFTPSIRYLFQCLFWYILIYLIHLSMYGT